MPTDSERSHVSEPATAAATRLPKFWTWAMFVLLGTTGLLSLLVHPTYWLTCISDTLSCGLWILAAVVMLYAAQHSHGRTRIFWIAFAASCALASVNLGAWTYFDVIARTAVPDPFWADIPLFLQPIPMMAAVALQPHRGRQTPNLFFGTLNFLILLLWWVYIYSFRIFPHEYVVYNSEAFNRYYNILYIVEFLILLAALGWSWMTTTGGWRKLYLQLFIATAVYIIAFQALNSALLRNAYYPGSSYDVLDNFATCLFIAIPVSFMSRGMASEDQPELPISLRWNVVWSVVAASAVLSVPVTGLWTLLQTNEPPALQRFRLVVTLIASAILAICVFLRQRVMDTRLTGLVSTSQETLENLQRVQAELVANERLGSMGQLVAGAAHEINNPLTAVLGYSDLLVSQASLSPAQTTLVSNISQEARRARNLVSDLLVFARKAPSEKAQIDVLPLLQRAVQMESVNAERASVQMVAKLSPLASRIWGSTHELFQAFQQLLSGLADRMEQLGGGTLLVRAHQEENTIHLEFSCLNSQGQSFEAALSPCLTAARRDSGLRFRAVQATIENHRGRLLAPDPGRVMVTLPASTEFAASASSVR